MAAFSVFTVTFVGGALFMIYMLEGAEGSPAYPIVMGGIFVLANYVASCTWRENRPPARVGSRPSPMGGHWL